MIPLLEIKSLTALNSVSNLTVKAFETGVAPGLGVGVVAVIGVGASLLEQAAAKQETQTAAKPPETVCKNFALFIEFYFPNILNQNLFKKIYFLL
jgi:hypothetical protein